MTTKTPINAQTAGPLCTDGLHLHAPYHDEGTTLVADLVPHRLGSADRRPFDEARQSNARLLAAAYTAFDRAGRTLNVDAAILAESIDVAALVCAARDAIALMRQLSDEQLAPVQDALDGLVCALDPIP